MDKKTIKKERIYRTLWDKYVRSMGIVAEGLEFDAPNNFMATTTTGFQATVDLDSLVIDVVTFSGVHSELQHCLDGLSGFIDQNRELLEEYIDLLIAEVDDEEVS